MRNSWMTGFFYLSSLLNLSHFSFLISLIIFPCPNTLFWVELRRTIWKRGRNLGFEQKKKNIAVGVSESKRATPPHICRRKLALPVILLLAPIRAGPRAWSSAFMGRPFVLTFSFYLSFSAPWRPWWCVVGWWQLRIRFTVCFFFLPFLWLLLDWYGMRRALCFV